MNCIIVHGTDGNPDENWFPWLKSELGELGYDVFVPKFPTPKGQTLENWFKVFKNYERYLDRNSIIVGHSIGVAFLLNVLEQRNKSIRAAFFVGGWTGLLNNPMFDKIIKTFSDKKFDWTKIKQNCKKFYIFHSDNDPYVPLEMAKDLAKNLDANLILVKGAGHFNSESGYTKFPLLLESIKNLL